MIGVSTLTSLLLALTSNKPGKLPSTPSFLVAQVLSSILQCPPDVAERYVPMIAPLPRSIGEWQRRKEIDHILAQVFDSNPNAGYEIKMMDEWTLNGQQFLVKVNSMPDPSIMDVALDSSNFVEPNDSSTYGEITTLGTRQLLHAMGLYDCDDVHLFDLGSGVGKLVTQTAMELKNGRATGVELSPSRHEAAVRARQELEELRRQTQPCDTSYDLLSAVTENADLVQDDLLQVDLSTATHIYVASLCFPPSLMQQLEDKLCIECHDLQCVASLKRFPNDLQSTTTKATTLTTMHKEMSWTKPYGCPVYIYHSQ